MPDVDAPDNAPNLVNGLTLSGKKLTYSALVAILCRHYAKEIVHNFKLENCIIEDVPYGLEIWGNNSFLKFEVKDCSFTSSTFVFQNPNA